MRIFLPFVVFGSLVASVPTSAATRLSEAADWPQWRGASRDGVSSERGLAETWPEGGPPVAWQVDTLGEGYGAVAVVGRAVFVQGTSGDRSVVMRLSADTGRTLWSTALGPRLRQDRGNGPRSTPTVVDDKLYALNGMGELAQLDTATGEIGWQFNILERFGSRQLRWGISESPLVDGDRLYVMPGGRGGAIAALDRHSGETLWTSGELNDSASYSSLIAADIGEVRALIGFTQSAGVGVRMSDGKLLWRYTAPANATANAATPVYGDGLVFYTSSYGVGGGALRVVSAGDAIQSGEAYFATNLQNHHGGVILYQDHLYGFFGPALGCVELSTGEIKWRARSVGKGSLTLADGKLFLLGEKHRVGLAEATPEGYRELGRFEIEDLGEYSWSYPVVSGGRLYIRNQERLTAYDVAK